MVDNRSDTSKDDPQALLLALYEQRRRLELLRQQVYSVQDAPQIAMQIAPESAQKFRRFSPSYW